jgi:hypothetical protein
LALSGHGATSDLSPLCAPKQTPATTTGLWVHSIGHRCRACRLICPTGKSAGIVSSPSGKNISLRRLLETPLVIPAVPPRIEGRIAIVTNVGCGMQWTRVAAQDGRGRSGRRSRVVLTPRRWRQLGDDCFGNRAGDGDKKPGSPGRARRKPLKPLRREGRAFPANLW